MKDRTGWNKYRRGPIKPRSASECVVTIDALSSSGDGIGRWDGRAVFVPLTMPGDVVRVKLVQQKKKFSQALLLEIISPSDDRIEPQCEYFGRCGGCQWQHIPYQQQIVAKHQHLNHVLAHIGEQRNPDIRPLVEAPDKYHYRNRIQGEIRDGQFFYRHKGSGEPVSINRCAIADASINDFIENTDLRQVVQGRVEIATGEQGVTVLPINDRHSTELGFRQVNSSISKLLTRQLRTIAATHQHGSLIDLYCGRGAWAINLALADPKRHCVGVDSSADNIRIAREAAQSDHVKNVEFVQARVEQYLRKLPLSDSLCVVDPPRAGLHVDVCKALCTFAPARIVYISCHPATLARDLGALTQQHFQLQSVTPLDMFPQTPHLECLALLERCKN